MPCFTRKSSSARAITSTMALPMPRTSYVVGIGETPCARNGGGGAAQYSRQRFRGNLLNVPFERPNALGALPIVDALARLGPAMAWDAPQLETPDGVQTTRIFRCAADRKPAPRQLSRRNQAVRRAAAQLRLHLLRRRSARDHRAGRGLGW